MLAFHQRSVVARAPRSFLVCTVRNSGRRRHRRGRGDGRADRLLIVLRGVRGGGYASMMLALAQQRAGEAKFCRMLAWQSSA